MNTANPPQSTKPVKLRATTAIPAKTITQTLCKTNVQPPLYVTTPSTSP